MVNRQFKPIIAKKSDAVVIGKEILGVTNKSKEYHRRVQALLNESKMQYESSIREKLTV
ncbi:hypothetical protein AB1K84_18695 [Mesobacillus foraminis]|uniref:hypothetical protein n=1 Tax=Mesobacillus foraminis TaxID=279826 RepID=UPI0039A1AEC0